MFEHAADSGNMASTRRRFGISRETYYQWKRALCSAWGEGAYQQQALPGESQVTYAAHHRVKDPLPAPHLSFWRGKNQLVSVLAIMESEYLPAGYITY